MYGLRFLDAVSVKRFPCSSAVRGRRRKWADSRAAARSSGSFAGSAKFTARFASPTHGSRVAVAGVTSPRATAAQTVTVTGSGEEGCRIRHGQRRRVPPRSLLTVTGSGQESSRIRHGQWGRVPTPTARIQGVACGHQGRILTNPPRAAGKSWILQFGVCSLQPAYGQRGRPQPFFAHGQRGRLHAWDVTGSREETCGQQGRSSRAAGKSTLK